MDDEETREVRRVLRYIFYVVGGALGFLFLFIGLGNFYR